MLSLRIALRYLLSRKSHAAVNVISAVSMAGVAVAAAAMIVVLSVFNGFAGIVESKTSGFTPTLRIERADGAIIPDANALLASLDSISRGFSAHADPHGGTAAYAATPMIELQAFAIGAGGRQMPVTLKGLAFIDSVSRGMSPYIVDGTMPTATAGDSLSVVSAGLAMGLGVRPQSVVAAQPGAEITSELQIVVPRRGGRVNPAALYRAFLADTLAVEAVYQSGQEDKDGDVAITDIERLRALLDYTTEATSVWLWVPQGDIALWREKITYCYGSEYSVLDRRQQEADSFRMIAIEKWITFLMLGFILIVASFNIISTLALMVVEKQPNMAVLTAMGATRRMIGRIFGTQGWLITVIGGIGGLAIGSLLVLGQQHYGWIKLQAANPSLLAVDAYPVALHPADLLISLCAILLISLLISLLIPLTSRPED